MSEIKFKLAAGTNVGLVRDNNEDNFVVCSDLGTTEWLIPQVGDFADLGELGALLVVADGMGGANAGDNMNFVSATGDPREMHVANFYMEEIMGEKKLFTPAIMISTFIIIVYLIIVIGGTLA